ncbi:hypothetical protein [Yimella sp. NH-Cas1]|uniref:hypothetical protein n=1 Tax=Yimella sp. NH-Cas1 TaxID=2917726 RepID=UPI001EFA90D4|nr:hypothetical protein [Yimella sp. NH-Cas1]MCG8656765.1 hypothetical protein [Yimella sp. NH-Cas1]
MFAITGQAVATGFSVGDWLMSPGFGGAAAVVAASLAFTGAWLSRRSENNRAREERWWAKARWATELVNTSGTEALGIAALDQLVDEASDVEAAKFASIALEEILFPDDEVEIVDGAPDHEAESMSTESEDS